MWYLCVVTTLMFQHNWILPWGVEKYLSGPILSSNCNSLWKIYFCDKNNLLKSQFLFSFSSYCSFVFFIALSMSWSIFSMLLHVSTLYGLVVMRQRKSKIRLYSWNIPNFEPSYFFEKFLILPSDPLEKL